MFLSQSLDFYTENTLFYDGMLLVLFLFSITSPFVLIDPDSFRILVIQEGS